MMTNVVAASSISPVGRYFVALLISIIINAILGSFMFWAVFAKAQVPAWWSIVPVLQTLGLLRVAGRPWWWIVFWYPVGFIPYIGWLIAFVFFIILCIEISRAFGHGGGFAVGLVLLGIIFFPILGFGSDQYQGSPSGASVPAY